MQGSLDKLGFIPDLLLVHSPFISDVNRLDELWTMLEDLVLDGTLKGCSLGVSNFRPQDLDKVLKVARIKPAVNRESLRNTSRQSSLTPAQSSSTTPTS